MITALTDATILTGDAVVEGHALIVQDGKIIDIAPNRRPPSSGRSISCGDCLLAPGLIDAQVNGGGNILFNNQPTAEAGLAIAAAHRAYGTTSLLLTCITDTPDITRQAIEASRAARQAHPSILGIHIEGPHLSIERRGVHKADLVRPASDSDLALYQPEKGEVMLITVAPETVTAEQIARLKNQGVTVALGHTAAEAAQIRAALQAGATGFTHLFNGMGGIEGRRPGPAGIALDDRSSWCSIIADGHHISVEAIRLALRAKPPGKVILVSDAMPPAASQSPSSFTLYGETIGVKDNQCIDSAGRLAGAALPLLDHVRYCAAKAGVEIDEALRMASTYPAAFLGVGQNLGKLLPGYTANIIAIDTKLTLKHVWMADEVYSHGP